MANTDAALTEAREAVSAQTTVIASAVTLINSIAAQLEANADDPEEIAAIAASLRANSDSLAAAVQEHTPQEPPTPA